MGNSKVKLNSCRIDNIIDELERKGNIRYVSPEKSRKINRDISMAVRKARKDFEFKQKNSIAFAAKMELSHLNK